MNRRNEFRIGLRFVDGAVNNQILARFVNVFVQASACGQSIGA